MTTTLRLSDILTRDVAIEWFEAVALVREVADRVRDSIGGRGVPELDQIQLMADGTLSISGATKTDEPVRRMGQLLQACLVNSDPPVQLRLAAAQATSPEPGYPSIRDCSEALAYFERPDRPAVLRGLYARAASAPPASAENPPTLDLIAPLQAPESEKRQKSGADRRPKASRQAVLVMASVTMLIAAAAVYTQLVSAGPVRADVSSLAVKASDAVGTTLVKGISAVSETVGLGRFVPPEGSGAPPPAAAKEPTPSKPTSAPTPRRRGVQLPPSLRIFDLAEAPSVGVPVPAPLPVPDSVVTVIAAEPVASVADATVYSADDPTVAAPIGMRPQLPRVLPSDVSPDRLSEIELVVLADGTVGSVRLMGDNGGVLEGMLLSAAKAWKFKPAEKDGRAVAYRKIVWLVRD